MLNTATIKNFGPLPDGQYQFASGMNVIVGENGLGKTHLLKLLYSVLKVNADAKDLTKTALASAYADKLKALFRPDEDRVGRLVKRKQGREKCEVVLSMDTSINTCSFAFATQAKTSVQIGIAPHESPRQAPVFIPTRELVTLCPWFTDLYENYYVPFEETWYDTVSLLGSPSVRGPRELLVKRLLQPIEAAMGGKVVVDANGRFYLNIPGEGKMEMPLVAEGLRKLAMLARLISTGVLLEKGYLFWDEPETNLNPKLLKVLARSILTLCQQGIQVFVATHSYFLMKEIDLLNRNSGVDVQYLGLSKGADGDAVQLEHASQLQNLRTLVALDEELAQYDRDLSGGTHA